LGINENSNYCSEKRALDDLNIFQETPKSRARRIRTGSSGNSVALSNVLEKVIIKVKDHPNVS
jgi:hypothetical protein